MKPAQEVSLQKVDFMEMANLDMGANYFELDGDEKGTMDKIGIHLLHSKKSKMIKEILTLGGN